MDLVPVDHDPFANAPPPAVPNGVTLQPVDHDPWAPYVNPETGRPEISVSKAPAEGVVAKSGRSIAQPSVAEQVAGFPQRAADMTIGALGPIGEAGMTVGDMLRTGHVDPRDIPQVAGGVMLGVAAPEAEEAAPLEAGAEAVAKGITAYHGSPYDFDKFDLSKIGTGEGAQAYGHGLYFAENPETAQFYKDALTNRQDQEFTVPGTGAIDRTTLARTIANDTGANTPYGATAVLRDLAAGRSLDEIRAGNPQSFGPAIDWVEKRNVAYSPTPPGKTYQVSINADPEHFLDWDKPLSAQSDPVRQKLVSAGFTGAADDSEFAAGLKRMSQWMKTKDYNQSWRDSGDFRRDMGRMLDVWDSGGDQAGIEWLKSNPQSLVTYKALPNRSASFVDEVAKNPDNVDKLRQAGIPGIKYLDQGSRNINGTVTLQSKYRAADLDSSDDIGERFFASRFKSNGGNLESTIEQLKSDSAAHPNDLTVQKTLAFAQNPENEFTYRPPVAQTKNYVVFDDKLIDIIKKYGLAGLIAGGASHFATQPVDHDPFAAQSP